MDLDKLTPEEYSAYVEKKAPPSPLMKNMAELTDGGMYFRATNKKSLESIFKEIDQMEKTKIDVTQYNQTKDEHMPFVLIALAAMILAVLLSLTYFKTTP